jgi:hypothetical protein
MGLQVQVLLLELQEQLVQLAQQELQELGLQLALLVALPRLDLERQQLLAAFHRLHL